MKDILKSISELKKQRDAVILAHYYVDGSVQEIADHVGDSYYLSKIAANAPQKTILFCGVRFMGESAKILNPDKVVIMPDYTADCPMAHMVNEDTINQVRKQYDDLAVVCYINSTAEIKANSDVCVTSSNAEKIVKALPQKNILFIPDRNLAKYISKKLPEKNFIFNEGFCHVHNNIKKSDVEEVLKKHPGSEVLVHPECTMSVIEIADYVGSTSGIIEYATKSKCESFVVCTEYGILHQLKLKNPDKQFFFPDVTPLCSDMKKITLIKVEQALQNMENEILLEESLIVNAEKSLRRMIEIAQ